VTGKVERGEEFFLCTPSFGHLVTHELTLYGPMTILFAFGFYGSIQHL
jgi:hypothetical protein